MYLTKVMSFTPTFVRVFCGLGNGQLLIWPLYLDRVASSTAQNSDTSMLEGVDGAELAKTVRLGPCKCVRIGGQPVDLSAFMHKGENKNYESTRVQLCNTNFTFIVHTLIYRKIASVSS